MTTELTVQEKEIVGSDQFQTQLDTALVIGKELLAITITSREELEEANNKCILAKKKIKQVAEVRKAFTKPLDDQKKLIMGVEKKIVAPIADGTNHVSKQIIDFNKKLEEEARKKEEELKKQNSWKDEFLEDLRMCYKHAKDEIEYANDTTQLSEIFKRYVNNKDGEPAYLQAYKDDESKSECLEQIQATIDAIKKVGKAKKEALQNGTPVVVAQAIAEKVTDELKLENKEAIETKQELAAVQASNKTIGVKKVLKYELEDITKVPLEYLQLDDKAIKEDVKENSKENDFEKEQPIPGIKFYYETQVSGR